MTDDYIKEYVETYELRADEGCYAPNERERFLIEDALRGYEAQIEFDLLKRIAELEVELRECRDIHRRYHGG